MGDQLYAEVPSLDLLDFTSGDPKKKEDFVLALGQAYENIGFGAIKNHGLSDTLTQALYDSVKKFFYLDDEIKKKYERPELFGQRGYISKGKEKAKDRNTGDLKEFYHVGQPTENKLQEYPENIWPSEVPEFSTHTIKAYETLEKAGIEMLRAIALFLDLDEHFFDDKVKQGNSIL